MNKHWKSNVLHFTLVSFLFSWPLMFCVDAWLSHVLIAKNELGRALIVLILGHGLAMMGPAIAGFYVQRKRLKTKFPQWQWSKFKYYLLTFVFILLAWLIPAIVGILFGSFKLQLSVESYYYPYMIIYIFLVPFSGLGEELGWCSFLLSYLPQYIGRARSVVLAGAIRGMWHLPVLLGAYIYKYSKGLESLSTVIVMVVVLSLQLIISNIFFGAAFSYVWFKTKSSPLVGWLHFLFDLARDFLTIIIIGYASNTIAMLFAQLPLLMVGAMFLDKLKKEDGIKGIRGYFKVNTY